MSEGRHIQRGGRTVTLATQDLRSEVFGCTAERVRLVRVLHVQLAETEVTQGDMTRVVKQDVLRFEVTAMFDIRGYNKPEINQCLTGRQRPARGDVPARAEARPNRNGFAPRRIFAHAANDGTALHH